MLNNLDRVITEFLSNILPHNQLFDTVFSFFSLYGFSIIIWIIAGLLLILFEEKKNKLFIIYLLTALVTTFILANVVLKNIFQRPRPLINNELVQQCPNDFSFPSGHASAAFAGAVMLSAFDKKRRWFYYLTAVIVSYSRIYLGCHFFFDVVAGGIVGTSISSMLLKFSKRSA